MATFADLQRAIEDLPDADYRVFNSAKKPATEAEIAALEARTGRPIPSALRELYAKWGVLVVEVLDSVWPRPKELDVLPSWQFSYSFIVLGVGTDVLPELSVAAAITPEMLGAGAAPFIRRLGARFLFVTTANGIGTWQSGDPTIEPFEGDAIDCILSEIRNLADGVSRLRAAELSCDALMEKGRAVGWEGPAASDIVNNLQKRPSAELAPHLSELVDALLPPGTLSMGCLDLLAIAGPAAFGPVADRVYAHYERSDKPYVLELLRKLEDRSARAIDLYRRGLESDDDDEFSAAREAVKVLGPSPEMAGLLPTLEERLEGELEIGARGQVIALLARLGAPWVPRVTALLGELADDGDFSALVRALKELPVAEAGLGPKLLERYRAVDPKSRSALEGIEALVALGLEERETMEPTLLAHFVPRGGRWKTRAEAVLGRWK